MKLRKILMYLLCLLMCFCTMQPNHCAMSINEKYGFSDIWSGVKENTTNLNYTLEL